MCFPLSDWKLLDVLGLYLKCLAADTSDGYQSGAGNGGGWEGEDKMGGGLVLTTGGSLAVDEETHKSDELVSMMTLNS